MNIPMQAAMMHPYGAVDFIDNSLSSSIGSSIPGMVVGGPPAFLEAHGIRYVPSDSGTEGLEHCAPMALAPSSVVPERDIGQVSHMDIDSRVQNSVQAFLANQYSRSSPVQSQSSLASETERRIRALKSDMRRSLPDHSRDLGSEIRNNNYGNDQGLRERAPVSHGDSTEKRSLRVELKSHEVAALNSNPEAMQRIDAAISREVRRSMGSVVVNNPSSRRHDW
jgi:hypothetical protein